MNTGKAAVAEFFGTFWLVFGGTGAAVLAASVGDSGIGWLGVSLAFGLTVVTMAYAVGHISGGHFNPAVTLGLWAGGRFPGGKVVVYIVAQVIGAICASAVLYVIASGKAGFTLADGFAANGYGDHSPAGYSLAAAIVIELLLTFAFLLVIHGVTDRRAPAGLAPLAIGLALTLIHLISIPVTNTSVTPPARWRRRCSSATGRSHSCGCSSSSRPSAASSAVSRTGTCSRCAPTSATRWRAPASRWRRRRPDARSVEEALRPYLAGDERREGPAALSAAGPSRSTGPGVALTGPGEGRSVHRDRHDHLIVQRAQEGDDVGLLVRREAEVAELVGR